MQLTFQSAAADDASALATLLSLIADQLTLQHGRGHWSLRTTEKGVLYALRTSRIYVAQLAGEVVATFRLATKKPWAIDTSYFTACRRPLYLVGIAVTPNRQGQGFGRQCLDAARDIAKAWPADAIRLDAYDHAAGAGDFYSRCGCTEVGRVSYRNTPLIYYELLIK